MVKNGKNQVERSKPPAQEPRSLAPFQAGVKTAHQLCGAMSLLMGDVIARRLAPNVSNAVCNAAGKMLKAAEMQQKYGTNARKGKRELLLA